jgi:large subunit ribosomal protein L25
MRTVEIIGFKRANLGKTEAKQLRREASVPCVLYGNKMEPVHFHSPMILFRDLVYTPKVSFVKLNIEGTEYDAILQDIQFHPVNEIILHADFLLLSPDRKIRLDVPVQLEGTSPGVQKGGKLVSKLKKIKVEALPADMPENITVNISKLDLGKSIKVGEVTAGNYLILNSPLVTIATVEIPRALRNAGDERGK